MNLNRIFAMLRQEYYMVLHSFEVMVDIFLFPVINIVIFGFLSFYLGAGQKLAGDFFLMGMMLWQFVWIIEYSVSVGSLWNIWSRNLSNIFISPITLQEYIFAHTLSGILKSIILMVSCTVLAYYAFNFNLLDIGFLPLLFVFINFTVFAFSSGIFVLGLIFRFGTRIQALGWGLITFFQPLSASFFPVKVLPLPLQYISYLFPTTYSFEAARTALVSHVLDLNQFGVSFAINIVYLLLALYFFSKMFRKSLDTGQFARNEV